MSPKQRLQALCTLGRPSLLERSMERSVGSAIASALDDAASDLWDGVNAVVNAAPGDLGKIFLALDEFAAEKIDEEYSDDGSVHIQIECEEEVAETLKERLANATRGRAEFKFWGNK